MSEEHEPKPTGFGQFAGSADESDSEALERLLTHRFTARWGLGWIFILFCEIVVFVIPHFFAVAMWRDFLELTHGGLLAPVLELPLVIVMGFIFFLSHGRHPHYADKDGIRPLIGSKKPWSDLKSTDSKSKPVMRRGRDGGWVQVNTEYTSLLQFKSGPISIISTVFSHDTYMGLGTYCRAAAHRAQPDKFEAPSRHEIEELLARFPKVAATPRKAGGCLLFVAAVLCFCLTAPAAFVAYQGYNGGADTTKDIAFTKGVVKMTKKHYKLAKKGKLPITKCPSRYENWCDLCVETKDPTIDPGYDKQIVKKGGKYWLCPTLRTYKIRYQDAKMILKNSEKPKERGTMAVLWPAGAACTLIMPVLSLILFVVGWKKRR